MASYADRQRYTTVAIWLHWLIAAGILFNLATGLTFESMPQSLFGAIIPIHISSGITVLALTIVRIVWRLAHRPPPLLPMAPWERMLAHTVHVLLYLGMLAAPLTGWALVSAHADSPPAVAKPVGPGVAPAPKPRQTMVWGVISLPKIAPIARIGDQPDGTAKLKEAHETFEQGHSVFGWILLGLFVLHVAGALKHQFVDRRRELARMGLGTPEPAVG